MLTQPADDASHKDLWPNPPPALTGRDAQLQQWEILVRRLSAGRSDQSIIASGLRGVGKTVLLLELQGIAHRAGWVTSDPIEVRSDTDFRANAPRQHEDLAPGRIKEREDPDASGAFGGAALITDRVLTDGHTSISIDVEMTALLIDVRRYLALAWAELVDRARSSAGSGS